VHAGGAVGGERPIRNLKPRCEGGKPASSGGRGPGHQGFTKKGAQKSELTGRT